MIHSKAKLIVAGVVVLAAVSFLAFAGVREGWVYYLPVDEYVADQSMRESRVRLHGTVSEEDLVVSPAALSAQFDLMGEESTLRVSYSGVIPDMFQAGRDVVIEGRMGDASVFQADILLTKCASKYESEGGSAQSPHASTPTKGETR